MNLKTGWAGAFVNKQIFAVVATKRVTCRYYYAGKENLKNKVPTIVLFDGVCNLCNSAVAFFIRHDKKAYLQFSSLQSNYAQQLLQNAHLKGGPLKTIVLLEKNKLFIKSDAALKIVSRLNGLYPPAVYIYICTKTPPELDQYDVIARNRYRWFGKQETCMVPDANIKARFIG